HTLSGHQTNAGVTSTKNGVTNDHRGVTTTRQGCDESSHKYPSESPGESLSKIPISPSHAHPNMHTREGHGETLATGADGDQRPLGMPSPETFARAKRIGKLDAHVRLAAQRFRFHFKESGERHTPEEWQGLFVADVERQWGESLPPLVTR